MLKRLAIFIMLILLLGGGYAYFRQQEDAPASVSVTTEKNATEDEEIDPSALGLVLKTIQLTQGEKGAALWRLNATAAQMIRQEDRILVNFPKLMYYMPPDNEVLKVVSKKGDIDQNNQIIRFINDVRAFTEQREMTGDILVYNGTARTMAFPAGGHFKDEGMQGSANVVTWFLDTKIITGSGDVDVTFQSSASLNSKVSTTAE